MFNAQRFPFLAKRDELGVIADVPYLPLTLTYRSCSIEVFGLLDTGASVNVLPYSLGVQLGAVWEEQTISIPLAGNLTSTEARGLVVLATVALFEPVRLALAWTRNDNIPLLLGRSNFFTEFDVCFYAARAAFDIRPKQS